MAGQEVIENKSQIRIILGREMARVRELLENSVKQHENAVLRQGTRPHG